MAVLPLAAVPHGGSPGQAGRRHPRAAEPRRGAFHQPVSCPWRHPQFAGTIPQWANWKPELQLWSVQPCNSQQTSIHGNAVIKCVYVYAKQLQLMHWNIVEPAEAELGWKTNIYQEETTWDSCGGKDGRQLAPAMGFQLECWSGGGQKWGGGKRWENLDFGLVSGP